MAATAQKLTIINYINNFDQNYIDFKEHLAKKGMMRTPRRPHHTFFRPYFCGSHLISGLSSICFESS